MSAVQEKSVTRRNMVDDRDGLKDEAATAAGALVAEVLNNPARVRVLRSS
jgi:hypothetical protein